MTYRCEATSVEGFIQQLACNYIPHGYWFYVSGFVPDGKDPAAVDCKLTEKYGICVSRQTRARRKLAGSANLHYLRYGRYFVILATHGKHPFFAEENVNIRDLRKVPIKIAGYSVSFKKGGFRRTTGKEPATRDDRWHAKVQISRDKYAELKAYYRQLATRRSAESLGRELFTLPFQPYAPVRQQLLNLLRIVNKARREAALEQVPYDVLRYRRDIVKPFAAGPTPTGGTVALSDSSTALAKPLCLPGLSR